MVRPVSAPFAASSFHRDRLPGRRIGAVAARVLVACAACVFGLATLATGSASARPPMFAVEPIGTIRAVDLPYEGRQTLAAIRAGGPFLSRRDGIVFGNRERVLPRQPRGYYAEYTVPTPGAPTRGARRIIAGRGETGDFRTSGEYYYTSDHYETFRRIVQ
jgi:ribonuclease T1